MPIFRYHALDPSGKKIKGSLEADHIVQAKEQLRYMGLMPTEVREEKNKETKEQLNHEALLTFTLQLSQLVGAHLPLYDCLVLLEEESRKTPYHHVLHALCQMVKRGKSLSEAMKQFPKSFNTFYVSMIYAGESVGALDKVLLKLAEFLEKKDKLQKELLSALIYPTILATFSLIVIFVLLGFVVPSIEGIFKDRPLNGLTWTIIALSRGFRSYWWLLFLFFSLFIGGLIYFFKSPLYKKKSLSFLLKIPVVKTLILKSAYVRFCRSMATLLGGGLPMMKALELSKGMTNNIFLEEEIEKIEKNIVSGSSLSAELKKSKLFPKLISRLVSVGENTGSLNQMFDKLAKMYEEDVDKMRTRLLTLSQPIILIFMGIIIALIMMAILLPLTDLASLNL